MMTRYSIQFVRNHRPDCITGQHPMTQLNSSGFFITFHYIHRETIDKVVLSQPIVAIDLLTDLTSNFDDLTPDRTVFTIYSFLETLTIPW